MSETMEAGRELDALVAEKVMELLPEVWPFRCRVERHSTDEGVWCYRCGAMVDESERVAPPFSTDIASAWLVVSRMIAKGLYVCIEHSTALKHRGEWSAWVDSFNVQANTAPLAICRAALAALAVVAAP